jgi:hypothetical protein
LIPNHFHLLLRSGKAPISTVMRGLLTVVLKAMSKARIHLKGDERILGDSDFVKEILAEQKERFERRYWLQAQGYNIERVVEKVAKIFEMEPAEVRKQGNQPLQVKARGQEPGLLLGGQRIGDERYKR